MPADDFTASLLAKILEKTARSREIHDKIRAASCMGLDHYLHQLTQLRTDTNRSRWTEATAFRAPHKPFLLLSILDLAAQGQIDSPFIKPSFELIERFARYWDLVRPPSGKCNMAYPFYHMRSEGFWELVPRPGLEQQLGERITSSMSRLKNAVLGARIDQGLY